MMLRKRSIWADQRRSSLLNAVRVLEALLDTTTALRLVRVPGHDAGLIQALTRVYRLAV